MARRKILVLGAGRVARPLVNHLLRQPEFQITVADQSLNLAQALVAGHQNGFAVQCLASDNTNVSHLIGNHDLVVSLLPAPCHPAIAQLCLQQHKHLVTTSYVSPAMRELDGSAREAGLIFLNEMGLDPGLDHMLAMRIIDEIHARHGRVVSFQSYCGGLPAPEANNNPWGYKFSWSPRGVCTAARNAAVFLENGAKIHLPAPELFTCRQTVNVEGIGPLESIPNRDSLSYIDAYGLTDIETMFRGTLRYPGWGETMKQIVSFGFLDESPRTYPANTTFADYTEQLLISNRTGNLRAAIAAQLHLPLDSPILDRLEWLGLLSHETISVTGQQITSLDILANRMAEKMSYQPGERDMIVLLHFLIARFPDGKEEEISATLIDYGLPHGDTAMARTVGLPAAIGAQLILNGTITRTGVLIPVLKEIYEPVLDALADLGLCCIEKTTIRDNP